MFIRLVNSEPMNRVNDGAVWFDAGQHLYHDSSASQPDGTESRFASRVINHTDGLFELRARSRLPLFASAKSTGHARTVFAVVPGHETLERAFEVGLVRDAGLQVTVLDHGAPIHDAQVVVFTAADNLMRRSLASRYYCTLPNPRWAVQTDRAGRAEFHDLPPLAPLSVTVQRASQDARPEGDAITLQPGEVRALEIRLGAGAKVEGSILDATGDPVAGRALWRISPDEPRAQLLGPSDVPAASTTSDAAGHFSFDDVPNGTWLVGPAPSSDDQELADASDVCTAIAQLVVVGPETPLVRVRFQLDCGLYLAGVVRDPFGSPVPDAYVEAYRESSHDRIWVPATANEFGEFSLGPLPAGDYRVYAQGQSPDHAPSAVQHVAAGDAQLELRLGVAGSVQGHVVDSLNRSQDGVVTLAAVGATDRAFDSDVSLSRGGAFRLARVPAGTYVLNCTTAQGWCGRAGPISIAAGQALRDVKIVAVPASRLILGYDGAEVSAVCTIMLDGAEFDRRTIARGSREVVAVPSGPIELWWVTVTGRAATRQVVDLDVGVQELAVFTDH